MKYTTLLIILILCYSCNNDSQRNGAKSIISNKLKPISVNHKDVDYETVDVDLNQANQPFELSKYYNIEFLMLEETKKTMIGEIDKVILTPEYIYVMDGAVAQKLFQFDRKGRYLRNIGELGHGPGEYSEIADFDISESEQEIYLYADDDRKIIVYGFDGKLKKETIISEFGFGLNRFPDGSYLTVGRGSLYNVNFWNKVGKEVISYSDKDFNFLDWQGVKPISKQHDSCFIHFPFNNYIYKAENSKLNVIYYIDFKGRNFPLGEIISYEKLKRFNNSNDYGQLGPFVNTKSMLCFHVYDGDLVRNCFYFKQKQELIITNSPRVSGIPVYNFVGDVDDGMILNGDPYKALGYFDWLKSKGDNTPRPSGLENLTNNSNPFIIVLTPKAGSGL